MNQLLRFSLICLAVIQWGIAQDNQPNILIITLDDMNWDSAGIYGNTIPEITPNIDQLSREGLGWK